MIEGTPNIQAVFHLAGIIPVAGQPLDFDLPWHDSCAPIAPDYLAVERAIVECAYAGCETIWICSIPIWSLSARNIESTQKTDIK